MILFEDVEQLTNNHTTIIDPQILNGSFAVIIENVLTNIILCAAVLSIDKHLNLKPVKLNFNQKDLFVEGVYEESYGSFWNLPPHKFDSTNL